MKSELQAAMAIADISPETDVFLEGYEEHCELSHCRCPQDFSSELLARVLILRSGQGKFVIVNLELLFSDLQFQNGTLSAEFPNKAAKLIGTKPEYIQLNNTHTHHAPMQLAPVQEERILEAIKEADSRLTPCEMHISVGHTTYGVSRGCDYGIDYERAYDDTLTTLSFFEKGTGKPIGMLFSVPIHNTLYGHGPGLKVNRHLMCCEFTGYACRSMEARSSNLNYVCMHCNGFYGGSGPVYKNRFYAESLDELKLAGREFADEIETIASHGEPFSFDGTISAKQLFSDLPTKQDEPEAIEEFGGFDPMPLIITAGRIGEIAAVGVNYEPFSILGARLRAEAPFRLVLPGGNVMGWRGYIPTKETFMRHKKHLEVECQSFKTPLRAEAEEDFYQKLLDTVCALKNVRAVKREFDALGVRNENKCAVYSFALPSPQRCEKLVVDFGQLSRTLTADDFTLIVKNSGGEVVYTQRVTGYSCSYIGLFAELSDAASAEIRVDSRYLYQKFELDRIPLRLRAITYESL